MSSNPTFSPRQFRSFFNNIMSRATANSPPNTVTDSLILALTGDELQKQKGRPQRQLALPSAQSLSLLGATADTRAQASKSKVRPPSKEGEEERKPTITLDKNKNKKIEKAKTTQKSSPINSEVIGLLKILFGDK